MDDQRTNRARGAGVNREPLVERICYDRDDILKVIRIVNHIVVSVDRIGSATAEKTEQEQAIALSEFFSGMVWQELSHARGILHSVFSDELGPDDMDELERELQNLKYWPERFNPTT